MAIFPFNAVSVVRGVYLVIDGSTLEQTIQEELNLSPAHPVTRCSI